MVKKYNYIYTLYINLCEYKFFVWVYALLTSTLAASSCVSNLWILSCLLFNSRFTASSSTRSEAVRPETWKKAKRKQSEKVIEWQGDRVRRWLSRILSPLLSILHIPQPFFYLIANLPILHSQAHFSILLPPKKSGKKMTNLKLLKSTIEGTIYIDVYF